MKFERVLANLNADDPTFILEGKIIIVQGDGRQGCKDYAPYDAIHVGAGASEVPIALMKQLKPGITQNARHMFFMFFIRFLFQF